MISMPIMSMMISIITIILLIIVIVIILSIDEKRFKKQDEIESLMMELKIPQRDRDNLWKNRNKNGLLKTEFNEDNMWNLYVKEILDCNVIVSYIAKCNSINIESYEKLISLLSDRNNKANFILLKSYRRLLWLIQDVKIRKKNKEIIESAIIENIEYILKLSEVLYLNKDKNIKFKINKEQFQNLDLYNYNELVTGILEQLNCLTN